MVLDETTICSRAHCRAVGYMLSKPDKYGIHYYVVARHKYNYVYNLYDNGHGNTMPISPINKYCINFPQLHVHIHRYFENHPGYSIQVESPSALWVGLVGQVVMKQSVRNITNNPVAKRYLITDNFYTRHNLAKCISGFTDGEVHIIGTVIFSYIEACNKHNVKLGLDSLENKPRGAWILVAVYNENYILRKGKRTEKTVRKI